MRFTEIEYGFQVAFNAAWDAYLRDTTPVGSAIITSGGELLATGGNCIYAGDGKGVISAHALAHAEINTILQLDCGMHPDLSDYTLYSTMEPCLMCFGAAAQGEIQCVKFAAMDKLSGAARVGGFMNSELEQKISIDGPDSILQVLQVVLIIFRKLERDFSHNGKFFDVYMSYCPEGVALGRRLFADVDFNNMLSGPSEKIFDYILGMYT